MSRRKDNEYIEINSPKLAVALSGTMNQVKRLINNFEDGLFSRFVVYSLDTGTQWSDVSPCQGCITLTDSDILGLINKCGYLKLIPIVRSNLD